MSDRPTTQTSPPARRDGAAQRPARPRPDALGRGGPRARRRDRASPRAQAARGGRVTRSPARAASPGSARRSRSSRSSSAPCREARLPFQDAPVSAHAPVPARRHALRRRAARTRGEARGRGSRCARAFALRGGELASYHGVEHKAIAAYEQATTTPRMPPRSTTAADRTWSRRCSPPTSPASPLLRRVGRAPAPLAAPRSRWPRSASPSRSSPGPSGTPRPRRRGPAPARATSSSALIGTREPTSDAARGRARGPGRDPAGRGAS